MDAALKKILKAIVLEMRHALEGRYDNSGVWQPGNLEQRLAEIGVRKDRSSVSVDELPRLSEVDLRARLIVDGYLKLREQAGVLRDVAVSELVRESAYTWANRLLALRCMEARELIDEAILQKDSYGGRSLEHHRMIQRNPTLSETEDDGRFAMLDKVFTDQAQRLPMLFDPNFPAIALRPSPATLKQCLNWLSGTVSIRNQPSAGDAVFQAPDTLGWAYQYWNTEEKDRVFERVRTVKNAKIAGADIVPATQLYTEDYMVKFLVQNSLGATWMGMHPESKLATHKTEPPALAAVDGKQPSLGATWMGIHPESKLATRGTEPPALAAVDGKQLATSEEPEASANGSGWEYYVRDADRAPVEKKPVREITFLDPACGSGHFLIEAFDLFYSMYQEEGELSDPAEICTAILTQNLFGIDIDARAVQIAEAALWMKAAERVFDYDGAATNLVAATASHLKGPAWEEFLAGFTKEPSIARVLRKFSQTMEHIDEIGSLARPAEDLRAIIQEEHATWEQQIREQKEANFLFPEMRKEALSGQLMFHEISDEEFSDRLFYRARAGIDAFTEQARESGDFDDQMLASETRAGFRLVDLLSRQYDVVAANPPYMGSKNFGPALKLHVESYYKPGKRDLYAAFILRDCELAHQGGRVAMVTQQSWMFNHTFADLRSQASDEDIQPESLDGVLSRRRLETLAHLGAGAFEEISGEVVNSVLFVFSTEAPSPDSRIRALRTTSLQTPSEKDAAIRKAVRNQLPQIVSFPVQRELTKIIGAPLLYWLSPTLLGLLTSRRTLGEVAVFKEGLNSTSISRFVRYEWETNRSNDGWWTFAKGGFYSRWWDANYFRVNWGHDGALMKQVVLKNPSNKHWSRRIIGVELFRKAGVYYPLLCRGSLGVRFLEADGAFDSSAVCIFPTESLEQLAGWLNSHLASYLARCVCQSLTIREGYTSRLPILPAGLHGSEIANLASLCLKTKQRLVASSPIERSFVCQTFGRARQELLLERLELMSVQHTLEGLQQSLVFDTFELSPSDRGLVCDELGTPVGWYPRIDGYSQLPPAWQPLLEGNASCADTIAQSTASRSIDRSELKVLKSKLRSLFEAGYGRTVDNEDTNVSEESDDGDDESNEEHTVASSISIPPDSLLEALAQQTKIHPISIFGMLKNGIENEGWRCLAEEQRLECDRVTVVALSLLGHRWPKQIEDNEEVPCRSDTDGIIPITSLISDLPLFERVQQRLLLDQINISDFVDLMGTSLNAWLATEFFKHHTKQFKKRPIAWQVQSGSFTARSTPAIACLIYYHKLDSDLFRKVRKLAEDMRKSRETELRGILSVAPEARSDRQEGRRVELEDAVVELQRFDDTLKTIAAIGFGPDSLRPTLRQYAINDALLALKARWLCRLSELVATGPLRDWLKAASQTDLHPDFGSWIASAMSHLDHSCAHVDPQPPDQQTIVTDPTAADLAKVIATEAQTMLETSLHLACDVWWKLFDEAVLQPLKAQVKELKDEQKQYDTQLKAHSEPEPPEARELKARVKELKAKIKKLNAEIAEKTKRAKTVREQIEAWRCKEPLTWGDWLAEQPMYDQISSLDHRRTPPRTIADFIAQESLYAPDINDGVRVNIAPLQKAGLLAADVLAAKDVEKAISDRAEWRADERRWVREGKLPQPGWWPEEQIQVVPKKQS